MNSLQTIQKTFRVFLRLTRVAKILCIVGAVLSCVGALCMIVPCSLYGKSFEKYCAGWRIPENLTFVPVDFAKDSLAERLLASGFESSQETLFSWLGVTYYLSAEAIDKTLGEIASLCTEGSALVFDCPDEDFFSVPEKRVQNTIQMAKAGGEPMQAAFSYAELEKPLARHGFRIYDWLTPRDIQRRIIDSAGANLKAFEHVNYCLAVQKGE